MKNKMLVFIVLFSLVLVGFSCSNNQGQDDLNNLTKKDNEEESNKLEVDEETLTEIDDDSKEDEVLEEERVVEEESANLIAVGGYDGTGLAIRSFDGNFFQHTVEAEINDPAEGKFYEGWLVTQNPSLQFFSTGKMEKRGDNYILTYQIDEDKSSFDEVVITEETESLGLDGNPETHVLEGKF